MYLDPTPHFLDTHKVGEEPLSQQMQMLDSADGDGEQTLAVCDWLRGNSQTDDGQEKDD